MSLACRRRRRRHRRRCARRRCSLATRSTPAAHRAGAGARHCHCARLARGWAAAAPFKWQAASGPGPPGGPGGCGPRAPPRPRVRVSIRRGVSSLARRRGRRGASLTCIGRRGPLPVPARASLRLPPATAGLAADSESDEAGAGPRGAPRRLKGRMGFGHDAWVRCRSKRTRPLKSHSSIMMVLSQSTALCAHLAGGVTQEYTSNNRAFQGRL